MIASAPIAELGDLSPDLLYVFVAGPGTGEGIAVALPGRGWIVVDGCDARGARGETLVPLLQIMDRWWRRDDRLEGFIWTHAHEDHAGGVARLLDRFPPQWIGLAGTEAEAREALGLLRAGIPAGAAADVNRRRKAVQTAIAVEDWIHKSRTAPLSLRAGITRPVGDRGVVLTVHAPDGATVARVLARWRQNPGRRAGLNEASVVFSLVHGQTCLVLGGDLPRYETGEPPRAVPGGWNDVLAAYPGVGGHHLLKVPHHGSKWALHPDLMPAGARGRAWLVTPYSSQGLPRVATDEGLTFLLTREDRIHLSALPVAAERQPGFVHPATVPVGALTPLQRTPPAGDAAGGGSIAAVAPGVRDFDDPVWCVALDDAAAIRGRWRGNVACEVVA